MNNSFQEVKIGKIKLNSFFQLKIKDVSSEVNKEADKLAGGESFFVSVIALTTASEIKNHYPHRLSVNDALKDEGEITINIKMTNLIGIERFMIVVSKDTVDLSFYKTTRGIKRNPKSIFRTNFNAVRNENARYRNIT